LRAGDLNCRVRIADRMGSGQAKRSSLLLMLRRIGAKSEEYVHFEGKSREIERRAWSERGGTRQ
jgi:hypothetical protein